MPEKGLPARPNLEQYKKQAKDLLRDCRSGLPAALTQVRKHHPRLRDLAIEASAQPRVSLTDAQLVIAREHGFESWPKFASHITTLNLERAVSDLTDPVAAFIVAASVPRQGDHQSGTLEEAELILARYPHVARANIYTAAIVADEALVRDFLARDAGLATHPGGPYEWDALTCLCFSRYLRIDRAKNDAFVRTARALLEAGANPNTGWWETIDQPNPRQIIESAIYGAAGIAQNADLTRLLLEFGADPNDEETPYHAAENYDLDVLIALVESGKLNSESITTLLIRKADWHDKEGIRLLLQHGADPNAMTRWGVTALHQALRRDNSLENIELLLDHGANPSLTSPIDGMTGTAMAARRGRGDVLMNLKKRGIEVGLTEVDVLIGACAMVDEDTVRTIAAHDPQLVSQVLAQGGTLLAQFAGVGNTDGVRCLLDLGVPADALSLHGDSYFDIARNSTALHAAAWRGWPQTAKLLIARGTPVNALDGKARTALQLAIKACVDSYWKGRRSLEWIKPLLNAGATLDGIEIPCGYDEADDLLRSYANKQQRKSS